MACLWGGVFTATPALAQPDGPAPAAKTAEVPWGSAQAGLRVRLHLPASVVLGEKVAFSCDLQNAAASPVKLKAKEVFGWLFVIQQVGQQKAAIFTEKLTPADVSAALAGGATHTMKDIDATGAKVYGYARGLKVRHGHPTPADGSALKAAGVLSKKLLVGPAKVRLMLYVPRADDRPRLLVSNTVDLAVQPPKMAQMDPKVRKAFVAQLLAKYKSSAWGGMKANSEAIRIGPAIVPDLVKALDDRTMPGFATAWMCTSVCRIACPASVEALLGYLKNRPDLVAYIVYHGPSQKSATLDRAIVERLKGGKGPIHLAVLGFLGARGRVPEEIMQAGLDSPDPRIRSAVAEAFAKVASDENVLRGMKLLKDKNPKVRAVAARVLGLMVNAQHERSGRVCGALVASLDDPDAYVRQRVCEALSRIVGKAKLYDPKAPEAQRKAAIAFWKNWWRDLRGGR